MISVFSCIAFDHDLRFVLMAALVCVGGCLLTSNLVSRLRGTAGARQHLWIFLAGLVGGTTVWTTHFSALLGYEIPFERTFDAKLTLVSLAIAVGTACVGFWITGLRNSAGFVAFGGLVFGLGASLMHYIGMAAYRMPALFSWEENYVVVSVCFAGVLGALATTAGLKFEGRAGIASSSLLMVLAIVSLHFIGMTGLTIVPFRGLEVPAQTISDELMLIGVVGVTAVLLISVAAAFLIDSQGIEEASATFKHIALHDPLTGIPNRLHLRDHLEAHLRHLDHRGSGLAVMAINMNRFKDINDLHGHGAGDMVLRQMAKRLSGMLGAKEFIARVGGDEFVAVKTDVRSEADIQDFCARIRMEVARPFYWQNNRILLSCSIGAALAPDHGRGVEELLIRANLAVETGRSDASRSVVVFSSRMEEATRHRATMAIDLRSAVEAGELELNFQPQNKVSTRELASFEALVRWRHPVHGLISPAEFIPIAEDTGLILEVGRWVLETACAVAAKWPDRYKVAVNVSAFQLAQDTLPLQVATALGNSGLAPHRLEIEITESGVITDQEHALKIVMTLKDLGVSVAMDDFGTGYSSLSTLQSFPFDKIKIDREFVKSLTESPQSAAIVRSTILLGSSLGITVLAEGVETEEQLAFLRQEGCEKVQGYLFGKPVPEEGALALIQQAETRRQQLEEAKENEAEETAQRKGGRVVPLRA